MRFLLVLLLPFFLHAKMLEVGESVVIQTLASQHEQKFTLPKSGIWIVTWDKLTTRSANEYFKKHPMPKDVSLIVDVSQVPFGIFGMFVKPDMQKYAHPILLSFDETYNRTFPYKEGNLTVLVVENQILQKILFLENQEDLEKFFK